MILAIRANNYLVYSDQVELSLKANLKIKRLQSNTIPVGNISVLKSGAIYGPNNVGKTCLVRAIRSIKNVLLSRDAEVPVNWYINNPTCYLGITFTDKNKIYSYDVGFTTRNNKNNIVGFTYERFAEILIDSYGNKTEKILFLKDIFKKKFRCPGYEEIEELMRSIAINNILIYTINTEKFEILGAYKDIFLKCANSIEIVELYNIPIDKTIQLLKDKKADKEKIVELIKKADIDIDDFEYVKPNIRNFPILQPNMNVPNENTFYNQISQLDIYYLMSTHRGIKVPSLLFDSTGTKKVVALASYIIEALEEGKTLVVDELDSSLHFKLTRAIVSLFNNIKNTKGQLIFTVQDITLLDCKTLFRKDQIWFASKEDDKVRLYSLDDYTAEEGVRAESDLTEQYKKGMFGAIPEPDLISVLIGGEG